MSTIYVARSATLCDWASDVGLSKHIYKLGVTDEAPKPLIAAAEWCGVKDWTLVKAAPAEDLAEDTAIERAQAKVKMIDPKLYPKLKGLRGVFKITLQQVENSMLIARAMAGEGESLAIKPKPADFGAFLIAQAVK